MPDSTDTAPEQSLEDIIGQGFDEAIGVTTDNETEGEPEVEESTQVEETEATEDASDNGDETEAEQDDSTAKKEQNRAGYRLRQVRANDEFVRESRENLDGWVKEADNDQEARLRQMEANQLIGDIERSRAQLRTDYEQAQKDISVFNPESPDFNQALYDRAMQRYSRDQLITENDKSGTPQAIGYKTSLLEFLKEEADGYYAAVDAAKSQEESRAQQTAAEKKAAAARARDAVDTAGVVSPEATKPAKTSFDSAFDRGFDSLK